MVSVDAQGLRAVEVRPGYKQAVKVQSQQPSRVGMTDDGANQSTKHGVGRRYKTPDMWALAGFKSHANTSVRRSQEI